MSDRTAAKPLSQNQDTPRGLIFAVLAYATWSFLPIYTKAIDYIPATELVAHRVIWSLPIAWVTLAVLGLTGDIRLALRSPRILLMACVTATLISINWGLFLWAVMVDRATEAALGYYINPLMNIALAAVVLRERLNPMQIVAVSLAVLAVTIIAWDEGGLPWLSIALPMSFASYAFLRRTLPIGPAQGFFLEILLLTPPALAYLFWLQWQGVGHFTFDHPKDVWLLIAAGPLTAAPLLLFVFAARMIRYSTIGMLQYITPTSILLLAVFMFGEPFSMVRGIAFGLIWVGLVVYMVPPSLFARMRGHKDGQTG